MNKKGFLEELGTYLAVLEEREQQDILEEYAQHIDMKIEKGLSEEEAIRDFGDIRELAAGILEAYHVNPEYQEKHGGRRKTDTESAAVKGRQAWTAAAGLFGSAGTMIKRFFSGCAGMLRRAAKHIWTFLTGPVRIYRQKVYACAEGLQRVLAEGKRTARLVAVPVRTA